MSDEEWLVSLRNRTHDLSNKVMITMNSVTILEQRCAEFKRRLEEIEYLKNTVQKLENQSQILKWLLGIITVILSGTILKFL